MERDQQTSRQLIESVLRRHCGVEVEILDEHRLQEDLGLESVGLLTLMVELENSLKMRLKEDVTNPPRTVGELARFLDQQRCE